jgi:hypothetical protein
VRALVLALPLPGAGHRDAVRAYLRRFWSHWSGPGFELDEAELERLTGRYAEPGAFTASIG